MMRLSFKELEKIQPARRELTLEEQEEICLEIERRIERDKDNPFFSSEWVGATFVQKLVVNEVTVRQYLEYCIRLWRNSSDAVKQGEDTD